MKTFITVLFSAALFTWFVHQAPPVQLNNQGTAVSLTAVVGKGTTPKLLQASSTGVNTAVAVMPQPTVQGCDAYRSALSQYGWDVNMAVAICKAESGGNTHALSYTGDRGLMQINWIHADMVGNDLSKLYDPTTNISVAWKIYSANGWHAWSTYLNGAFLRYL